MQIGDAASWAGAIGTVGALAFTAYIVRRQVDRERRADDYQRHIYANRVSITVENLAKHVEVINDSPDTIYNVGTYIRARSSGALIPNSGGMQNFISPGERGASTSDESTGPLTRLCQIRYASPPTTTGADPTVDATSARTGPTNQSLISPKRGSGAAPSSAASSTNTSGLRK
jgi:hypothetical protein